MRFSLRTLLLLPLAFVMALFAGGACNSLDRGCTMTHDIVTYNNIQSLARYLEMLRQNSRTEPAESEVNDWLSGRLAASDPHFGDISLAGPPPIRDSWGHPVRYVAKVALADGTVGSGLYSPGRDGISKSNGNDNDDLNTWSPYDRSFYVRERVALDRSKHFHTAVWLTPMFAIALLLVGRIRRLPIKKPPLPA